MAVVFGTEVADARQTINDVLMAIGDMEPGVLEPVESTPSSP
jgi:hypothetical protein